MPIQARRHPIIAKIERGLITCGVWKQPRGNSSIIIGVSGGADSIALLLGCVIISRRRSGARLNPIAVHVHHHLRVSADEDAAWVKQLCERLGVPFRLMHVHVGAARGNVYANARRLRYAALEEAAAEAKALYIAVAHQSEDQLETMIAALCRGTGLNGLGGMPWRRRLNSKAALIRPMLAVRRSECEDFCRAAGIEWRDDPSNRDVSRMRARLRRDVLPVLEELWPDSPRRAAATADAVRVAKRIVNRRVARIFGDAAEKKWDRPALQRLPVPLIAMGLRRAALHARQHVSGGGGKGLSRRHLLAAAEFIASDDRSPHTFQWPGELSLKVTSKQVTLDASRSRGTSGKASKRGNT